MISIMKTINRETAKDRHSYKDILCSCIGRIGTIKVPKAFYRVYAIPIKTLITFFIELGRTML